MCYLDVHDSIIHTTQHSLGDKHKMERFFHPGDVTVASVFAPVHYPPAPVLVFKFVPWNSTRTREGQSRNYTTKHCVLLAKTVTYGECHCEFDVDSYESCCFDPVNVMLPRCSRSLGLTYLALKTSRTSSTLTSHSFKDMVYSIKLGLLGEF